MLLPHFFFFNRALNSLLLLFEVVCAKFSLFGVEKLFVFSHYLLKSNFDPFNLAEHFQLVEWGIPTGDLFDLAIILRK